jgi:DNA-directed RNA polymerase specialized sigma24 family protein
MADLDLHLPRIAAGDGAAFGRWLAGAEGPLRAGLRGFAAQVDVEAVLQEALLRAWQVAPRLLPDGRPNALLRFAVRAARNLALDEARRAGFRAPLDDEELARQLEGLAAGVGPPEAPDPLLRRLIQACREKLARKPRAALDGRLASGGAEPDAEVAARLGMRTNTFLQNVTRARRALSECLRRAGVPLAELSP